MFLAALGMAACGGAEQPDTGSASDTSTPSLAMSASTAAGSGSSRPTVMGTGSPSPSDAGKGGSAQPMTTAAPGTMPMGAATSGTATGPSQGAAGAASATDTTQAAGASPTGDMSMAMNMPMNMDTGMAMGTDQPAAAGASSGAAGSGGASPGGFPRTGEEINIKAKGPYTVKYYSDGLQATEYASAVMYYPEDATPPFAAVALSPGFTAYGTDYEFVGDMLASHGIAALLTTPTSTSDLPQQRGEDLVAAVMHLKEENTREGSPLKGKIATDRIGITGHSMGGGGSLFGANSLGNMIRCVVPMEPWQPGGAFPMIAAPTMIIGAASDTIAAVSGNAQGHYNSIPDSVEKFLVVFEGDHYLSTDRTSGIPQSEHAVANENYDPQAAYMIPFYKVFLEDDERYKAYLYGPERSMTILTDYQASMM